MLFLERVFVLICVTPLVFRPFAIHNYLLILVESVKLNQGRKNIENSMSFIIDLMVKVVGSCVWIRVADS